MVYEMIFSLWLHMSMPLLSLAIHFALFSFAPPKFSVAFQPPLPHRFYLLTFLFILAFCLSSSYPTAYMPLFVSQNNNLNHYHPKLGQAFMRSEDSPSFLPTLGLMAALTPESKNTQPLIRRVNSDRDSNRFFPRMPTTQD